MRTSLEHERQLAAIREVLEAGELSYLNGARGRQFERRFADLSGSPWAVSCNSGTSALYVALSALDLPPGAEVITTPMTFVSTVHAIILAGLVPRLVDIEPDSPCLDPTAVQQAITNRTAALVPVHLYGHPCRMMELMDVARQYRLKIVEDVAQALGSRLGSRWCGTFGDAAGFSFCFTKIVTLCGEGGMILARDYLVARRAAMLRNVGYEQQSADGLWSCGEKGYAIGHNLRMLELQAAIGLLELEVVAAKFQQRRQFTRRLHDGLTSLGLKPYEQPQDADPVYSEFCLRIDPIRMRLPVREWVALLRARGVPANTVYQTPINRYPFFRDYVKRLGHPSAWLTESFANFEAQSRSTFAIRLSHVRDDDHLDECIQVVIAAWKEARS